MTASQTAEPIETSPSPERGPRPRARKIPVRAMGFPFDASIRRFWLYGDPLATHLSNGLNLLFPDGERFFIRSVKHYLPEIEDPDLVDRIKGFFGQEGRHGHEHERFNKILAAHGYDTERFLSWYREVAYEVLEKNSPPALRLSITAALEHFTASMAKNALTTSILDNAHPTVADLLRWHAAEEIEHKSVAFDVFQKVDGRYGMRVAGLVLGFGALLFFWQRATRDLLEQEAARGTDLSGYRESGRLNPQYAAETDRRRAMFRDAFLEYLRPDFHPDQIDDAAIARALLQSMGRADG